MRGISLLFWLVLAVSGRAEGADHTNRISGIVREDAGGASDVVVVLCDQATGLPLSPETYQPFTERKQFPPKILTTVSGRRGDFSFTNVPPGNYRLVAQKWVGPFKGLFEVHGGVIQLFGATSNIRVPSAEAGRVVLSPPGEAVLAIDMEAPNSGVMVVFSTEALAADPILSFNAPGQISSRMRWD